MQPYDVMLGPRPAVVEARLYNSTIYRQRGGNGSGADTGGGGGGGGGGLGVANPPFVQIPYFCTQF